MAINNKNSYMLMPPEGGWGFIVCIGMALAFINPLSVMVCFGLLYNDFLKSQGDESSAVAIISSAFFSSMSFVGLFSNSLFRKYSFRTVGIFGAVIYFLGCVLQIFVQSTSQLFIAYSILQGGAVGLIFPTCYSVFNHYFVERRVTMMSVTQSLIGIGQMLYPILVHKIMDAYGFRGCMAIIAALNGHVIFGMLVLHPVEWHMRKVPTKECEMVDMKSEEKLNKPINGIQDDVEKLEPLIKNTDQNVNRSQDIEEGMIRRSSTPQETEKWAGSLRITETTNAHQKLGLWQKIVYFLDLTLLKDPIYLNIVFGISCALYSDVAFFTFEPLYLFELGFTKGDAATILAAGATADLASRVFLACSSAFISIPTRYVYAAGALFTVVARFAFLCISDFMGMAIITAILGFLRTWIHITLPLVFAEFLPKERFSSGYGLFMFLQGNFTFLVGPIVGFIRDATKSYEITFHCLNFFMAACAFPWIIEIIYFKYKNRNANKQRDDSQIKDTRSA